MEACTSDREANQMNWDKNDAQTAAGFCSIGRGRDEDVLSRLQQAQLSG